MHRAGSSFGEGPGGWKQRPLSSGLFLQVAHICCCASWHRCFRRELPNRQLSDASVGLVGFILQITIVSVSAAISTRLTASHPNSEVKLVRAGVVLRWGTTREGPVLRFCCFALSDTLAASWLPFVLHPHRGSPAARRKSERKRGRSHALSLLACRAITCLPLVTVCSFGCRASAITGGGAELSRSALVSLRSGSAQNFVPFLSPSFRKQVSCGTRRTKEARPKHHAIVTARWQLP